MREVSVGQTSDAAQRCSTLTSPRELAIRDPQGVHPRVVMEVLGHSQISLTMDTYSHVSPALHGEAARKMDSLLAQS